MTAGGRATTVLWREIPLILQQGWAYHLHCGSQDEKQAVLILQDTASTIYWAKIASLSDVFVCVVSGTNIHNLWHHRLCHAENFVLKISTRSWTGYPTQRGAIHYFLVILATQARWHRKLRGTILTLSVPKDRDVGSIWIMDLCGENPWQRGRMVLLSPPVTDTTATYSSPTNIAATYGSSYL